MLITYSFHQGPEIGGSTIPLQFLTGWDTPPSFRRRKNRLPRITFLPDDLRENVRRALAPRIGIAKYTKIASESCGHSQAGGAVSSTRPPKSQEDSVAQPTLSAEPFRRTHSYLCATTCPGWPTSAIPLGVGASGRRIPLLRRRSVLDPSTVRRTTSSARLARKKTADVAQTFIPHVPARRLSINSNGFDPEDAQLTKIRTFAEADRACR